MEMDRVLMAAVLAACGAEETPLPLDGGCTPACEGAECGDDKCGGECGTCAADRICRETMRCEPACSSCASRIEIVSDLGTVSYDHAPYGQRAGESPCDAGLVENAGYVIGAIRYAQCHGEQQLYGRMQGAFAVPADIAAPSTLTLDEQSGFNITAYNMALAGTWILPRDITAQVELEIVERAPGGRLKGRLVSEVERTAGGTGVATIEFDIVFR